MSDPIDAELLIHRAVEGDGDALETLLLAYFDRVVADVASRIPDDIRGAISAEDVVQDAYIVAFQRIGEFESRGAAAFFAWLRKIAEHRLLDASRALRAAKRGGGWDRAADVEAEDGIIAALEMLPGHARTPSASAATREAVTALQAALDALHPHYRDALRMRYIECQPVAVCAARLQRTEGAFHMLLGRALAALRAQMGESVRYFTRKT